jgi:hypothetical protein
MRKKGKQFKQRIKAPPTMTILHTVPAYEIRARTAVEAFRLSFADNGHCNDLSDVRDLMMVAVAMQGKPDPDTGAAIEVAGIALLNLIDRRNETGKWQADEEELNALTLLVETSRDFWSRKSALLFRNAVVELQNIRASEKPIQLSKAA